jgi:hypothetical protein
MEQYVAEEPAVMVLLERVTEAQRAAVMELRDTEKDRRGGGRGGGGDDDEVGDSGPRGHRAPAEGHEAARPGIRGGKGKAIRGRGGRGGGRGGRGRK